MMNGIKTVIKRINKQDTPLKRVLRIKNLFIENKKEAMAIVSSSKRSLKNEDWLYQYADLKLNVLMDYNAMSLVTEIQFLLGFMLRVKKSAHQLYVSLYALP